MNPRSIMMATPPMDIILSLSPLESITTKAITAARMAE